MQDYLYSVYFYDPNILLSLNQIFFQIGKYLILFMRTNILSIMLVTKHKNA